MSMQFHRCAKYRFSDMDPSGLEFARVARARFAHDEVEKDGLAMSEDKQIYIELYSYRQTWRDLPQGERDAFANGVTGAVESMETNGAKVIAYGFNDVTTDRRAPYDFFCIYELPSVASARAFEKEVEGSGWYKLFDQVNISGPIQSYRDGLTYQAALKSAVEQ